MNSDPAPTQEQIDAEIAKLSEEVATTIDVNLKQKFKEEMKYKVIRDVWHAILDDSWMYVVVWSEPRKGKTTCKMRIAYTIYHDWEMVLDCIFFNLSGLLHKMNHNLPLRILEQRHRLHNRIPMLIGDDWGAQGNKAKTRDEPAWDLLKGAWDTYATKISCVFVSMNQPDEITKQLASKYTHELYLPTRGIAKYDSVGWNQNFYGWQPYQDKDWKQSFEFDEVPLDIYKRYDEQRMSLVDELNIAIEDKIIENDLERTIKRMIPGDYDLLQTIYQEGPMSEYDIKNTNDPETIKEAIKRCRARNLLVTVRGAGSHYKQDLTNLGLEILKVKHLQTVDPKELKRQLHAQD
ncbi:MAG: hypothetical protein ABSB71_07940 [Candidatus Bathyarchaeia archaeon]|jgi:hypothetical protein